VFITLIDDKHVVATSHYEGLYTVVLKARDYRGNEMTYSANFLVDNTVPSPAPPRVVEDDGRNR
jgi:hypothetical protein